MRIRQFGPAWRFVVVVSLLALISVAPTAAVRVAGPVYIIQPGDTLYDIALSFGLTVDALEAANPGVRPAALAIGNALTIPGYEGISGTLATHSLLAGESIDSLSLRRGLERSTLVRLNRLVNPHLVFIGGNMVVVEEADAGPALETGHMRAAEAGQGLLALAARQGYNSWALAAANRLVGPARLTPGSAALLPGGERPTTALVYPLLDLIVSPSAVQGRTVAITAVADSAVSVNGRLGGAELNFQSDGTGPMRYVALQGINRLLPPNLYPLQITAAMADGTSVAFSQAVPVRGGNYLYDDPLRVDPTTLDPAVTGPEFELIRSLVAGVTPHRQWNGRFVLPSVGSLRSIYGSLRSYNGGPYDSFHTGVDFSGGEDRAITAPASGVVVYTGALDVRGNATLIDHGWGIYTGYWHQSVIHVQVGQRVETGQVIGFNGATGRVTGPHLHWELWVGGQQVDPMQWVEAALP
jgi:murein DD-endopeptidase MepM/ murein hydrolase activator NlpD